MKEPKVKKTPKAKKPEKKKFCSASDCNLDAVNQGYCRLHYIQNWKTIKLSKQIKAERRLNAYIDRLSKKYPKDYLEVIKEGLESEDKFKDTMQDIELELEAEGTSETEKEFLEKLMRAIKDD